MSGKRVLIIDDKPIILHTLAEDLEDEGYIIDSAKNGEEGINKLKAKDFDLVITDLIMSPGDGHEVINEIINSHSTIKIIVITGYTNDELLDESLNPGITVLVKPYNRKELFEKVRDCFRDN